MTYVICNFSVRSVYRSCVGTARRQRRACFWDVGTYLENRLQQEEERQWRTRRFCYLDDICTTLPLSEKEARPHGKCKGMGLTLDIWMMWALVLGSVPCDVEGWYCTVRLQPNYVAYWLENLVLFVLSAWVIVLRAPALSLAWVGFWRSYRAKFYAKFPYFGEWRFVVAYSPLTWVYLGIGRFVSSICRKVIFWLVDKMATAEDSKKFDWIDYAHLPPSENFRKKSVSWPGRFAQNMYCLIPSRPQGNSKASSMCLISNVSHMSLKRLY